LLDGKGLFAAVREIIDRNITTNNEYQITDALQLMIGRGVVFAPFAIDEWFDCGKPEAMLETNRKLLKNGPSTPPIEGSIIIPPVSISPGAEIVNSIIGPYVSIAERCVIHSSVVRDSVIAEGASVTDALLESSLVGANAVIRGGFKKLDVGDSSEISFK
ncbi:MAG TPA: nucleotidyl transferase, partial [Candidatus Krumholzibacteria bacterium]|nr:nucleotidyl transferase [Candidatus Krumholzibacteria bacterium]